MSARMTPSEVLRVDTKYQTYKAATAAVARWLARQAQKLGIITKTDAAAAAAASKAADKGSYGISIDDFFAFTRAIVDADPRIGIPLEIVTLAEKAYSLRKEWSEILRGRDEESDKRHDHFISVIGQVFEQLKGHYDANPSSSQPPKVQQKQQQRQKVHLKGKNTPLNQFHVLTVESEQEQSDQEAASEDDEGNRDKELGNTHMQDREARRKAKKLARKKKARAKKKAQEKVEQEHEEECAKAEGPAAFLDEGEEDAYFVMMCLLSDLSSMRAFVKEMWTDYAAKKIDLITVSLTTNATFDIIRTYEQDCPAIAPLLKDYAQALKILLSRRLGENDGGLGRLFCPRNTPEQIRTMCSSLGRIEDLVDLTFANAFFFLNGPRHFLVKHEFRGKGMTINLDREPFGPAVRQRLPGYPSRFLRDLQRLASFAQDVYVSTEHDTYTQDHFTRQWKDFARTGDKTISLSEAFGAQIYLDIQDVCEADPSSAFRELQAKALQLVENLAQWRTDELEKRVAMWKEGVPLADVSIEGIVDCLRCRGPQTGLIAIDQGIFQLCKDALYEASGKTDRFDAASDQTFLQKNPLLCGIMEFTLVSGTREGGQLASLYPKSIMNAGQLYFACRMHRRASGKKGTRYETGVPSSWADYISNATWDDMEFVFEMLGEKAFFDGHVPASNHEIVNNNGTIMYFDEKIRKKSRRERRQIFAPLTPPQPGEAPTTRIDGTFELFNFDALQLSHQLYTRKYVMRHDTTDEEHALNSSWTESNLVALLGTRLSAEADRDGARKTKLASSEKGKAPSQQQRVTLLETLKRGLQSEARALHFDMLSFHMRCIGLMTRLRDEVLIKQMPDLCPLVGDKYEMDKEDANMLFLGRDLYLAASSNELQAKLWQIGRSPPRPVPLYTSKVLVAIDRTMQEYLTAHGCRATEIKKIDVSCGSVKVKEEGQVAASEEFVFDGVCDGYAKPLG